MKHILSVVVYEIHLLKREIKDIDIATSASPDEIQAIFDQVIPVGLEHGTVVVVIKGIHMK